MLRTLYYIGRLADLTSSGPDGIPNVLLKHCGSSLVLPLSHLLDTSFKDGVLPLRWQIATLPVKFALAYRTKMRWQNN